MDCKLYKNRNMAKKIIYFFSILFLLLSTFYLGLFIVREDWFASLDADTNLNPVEPMGIIVSAALTIWIGWYITKKLTEQRFEKEYLIKDLATIEQKVDELSSTFQNSAEIDLTYISAKNAEIQLAYSRLENTFKLTDSEYSSNLSDSITNLFKCTTNFDESPVKIEKVDLNAIYAQCDKVILDARDLILKINKD